MCERCDQKNRETVKQFLMDIALLATGGMPEGAEYPEDCVTDDDREQMRAELIAMRAACILSVHVDMPPSIAAGNIAGMLLAAEIDTFQEEQARRQARHDAARFN